MTFEDYWNGVRLSEFDAPEPYIIAKAAWYAAMEQINIADNQTLAMLRHKGYVLVPVEPTEVMLKAARNAPMPAVHLDSFTACSNLILKTQYKAMIQAAQEEE